MLSPAGSSPSVEISTSPSLSVMNSTSFCRSATRLSAFTLSSIQSGFTVRISTLSLMEPSASPS
ncbi:hypothetical protein D3C76_984980 [compost metagenome]